MDNLVPTALAMSVYKTAIDQFMDYHFCNDVIVIQEKDGWMTMDVSGLVQNDENIPDLKKVMLPIIAADNPLAIAVVHNCTIELDGEIQDGVRAIILHRDLTRETLMGPIDEGDANSYQYVRDTQWDNDKTLDGLGDLYLVAASFRN